MKTITIVLILGLTIIASILPVTGAMQGYGAGNAGVQHLIIPEPVNYTLSKTEITDLLFMREEEQLAGDLYAKWATIYPLPIFGNIAQAEVIHASEVQYLLDRYNLSSEPAGNLTTGYENPMIQELSKTLAEQGERSLTDALHTGIMIEERDISDLDAAIANTTREDLIFVYENLRSGSESHLKAFQKQLS